MCPDKTEITDLMRLHLRLANIRNELEILENPEMRDIYEDVRQRSKATTKSSTVSALIVCPIGPLDVQRQHLDWCERNGVASAGAAVRIMPTLQHCLDACMGDVTVYLPAGRHAIKFAEPLRGNLAIVGNQSAEANGNAGGDGDETGTRIVAAEDDSKLLQVDGTLRISGCTLDCGLVRTGLVVRRGARLEAHNCRFVGAPGAPSNTKCAVAVLAGDTAVELTGCTVRHFAVGVSIVDGSHGANAKATVRLRDTEIADCGTAVDCAAASAAVQLEPGTRLGPNRRYGCAVTCGPADGPAKAVFEATNATEVPQICGDCVFVANGLGNVVRFGGNAMRLFDDHDDDECEGTEEEIWTIKSEMDTSDDARFAVPHKPKAMAAAVKSPGTGVTSEDSDCEQILVSDTESELCESVIMVDD